MNDYLQVSQQWEQQQAECQKKYLEDASQLGKELAATGVKSITFYYSGSGDSGCIDEICWHPENIDVENVEALEELVFFLLPDGWEIDDGCQGDVSFHLETGAININHRLLEYVDSNRHTNLKLDLD